MAHQQKPDRGYCKDRCLATSPDAAAPGPTNVALQSESDAEIIRAALAGDVECIRKIFLYLGAPDARQRQAMQRMMHALSDTVLWQHMLRCLAVHCWEDRQDTEYRVNAETSQRIDQSIAEVFMRDEYPQEVQDKEVVLRKALTAQDRFVRYAAAYLLGLRKDVTVIPHLAQMTEEAPKSWQVRAVRALGVIGDERCAPALIRALALGKGALHSEARQALQKLGRLAEEAWQQALTSPERRIRWQAARGLDDPGHVRSLDILAEGLQDDDPEVRWETSVALARLGDRAIPATLKVLSRGPVSKPLRQAAYHVLSNAARCSSRQELAPLLEMLCGPARGEIVAEVAGRLLQAWQRQV